MAETQRIWILAAAAVVMAVCGGIYGTQKEKRGGRVLAFKGLATLTAALPAFLAGAERGGRTEWLMFAALMLCAAADILLELYFMAGAAVFGVGHICLTAAFASLARPDAGTLVCFAVLLAVMYLVQRGRLGKLKNRLAAGILYGCLLCAMSAMSLTAGSALGGTPGLFAAAGGVSFFLSDNILTAALLDKKRTKGRRAALLTLYYLAVYLMGGAVFLRSV